VLTVRAPAKLNLVLEVLGRREGYHDICSIAQTIDLCDRLTFEPAGGIEFSCSEPSLREDNLVVRAAELLQQQCRQARGVRIHLEKRIPWGAGLGGGSSDAATTLITLNHLWDAGLSREQLVALGAALGSDVSLFLVGGTVLLQGRGDVVRPLPDHPTMHAIITMADTPSPPGKTALMYGRLRPDMFTRGQFVRAAAYALEQGAAIPESLRYNTFEKVADEVFDALERRRHALQQATGAAPHLAGSGPCLYALLASAQEADAAANRLIERGHRAVAVRFVKPEEPTA
jgi:4-diphosphocytidyl-2-C-methyl-D-erythritol kinase